MKSVLTIDHLHKSYKNIEAVKDLSLEVQSGEVYGLLGPNGSGKSTTLHSIVGMVRPSSGTISIDGHHADSIGAKRVFGFVPDDVGMPESLTGREYLTFVRRLYGIGDAARAEALVEIFDIGPALGRLIEEYSHGMKKKLQIAAALVHDPELLILDEPFRGLDPEAVINLKHLISIEKERGTGILIATHDLLMAQHYCDRVAVISKGRIAVEDSVPALLLEYGTGSLEDVFLRASGLIDRRDEIESLFARI